MEYEERVRQLKEEVRRHDDEYLASVEARRTAKSSEDIQAVSLIPARSRSLFILSLVPFINKSKARFGAYAVQTCPSCRLT